MLDYTFSVQRQQMALCDWKKITRNFRLTNLNGANWRGVRYSFVGASPGALTIRKKSATTHILADRRNENHVGGFQGSTAEGQGSAASKSRHFSTLPAPVMHESSWANWHSVPPGVLLISAALP
jgi:hypothetical protein